MNETCVEMKYIDRLVRMKRGPDLLALRVFPKAKEITESFGAYHAAESCLGRRWPLDDPRTTLVAVGDGNSPRTAATFALGSAWNCFSVDPRLRWRDTWAAVPRLHLVPRRVEEFIGVMLTRVVLVAVHSHASLDAAVERMRALGATDVAVIAIPCCVPQTLGRTPDEEYIDEDVASPHRRVLVWEAT